MDVRITKYNYIHMPVLITALHNYKCKQFVITGWFIHFYGIITIMKH